MPASKRLTRIYDHAIRLSIDSDSKIVLISDCHRGDGSNSDNYVKNQLITSYALRSYFAQGYTYIELGDGDDMWECKRFSDISAAHGQSLEIMRHFYKENRLYMIFGNHDMCKSEPKWVERYLASYERKNKKTPLFPGIKLYEAIVLEYERKGDELFLLHGHQVDFLNYNLWKLARFLVRYVWRPLELIGMKDPGSAYKNNDKKLKVEKKLANWAKDNGTPIIAGHTHSSVFPEAKEEALYFNDGCCVHPRCITAIEIEGGEIRLVKWSVITDSAGRLYVSRTPLAKPREMEDILRKHDTVR